MEIDNNLYLFRYGMVLARYKAVPNIKSSGCFGLKPLVAFTSEDSHYSIQKAIHWLGIGTNNLVFIKTDANGSMLIDDLIENIENVLKSERQPFFVNATAGTTVLGSFDNLECIASVCKKYKLWMHVDVMLDIVVQQFEYLWHFSLSCSAVWAEVLYFQKSIDVF